MRARVHCEYCDDCCVTRTIKVSENGRWETSLASRCFDKDGCHRILFQAAQIEPADYVPENAES